MRMEPTIANLRHRPMLIVQWFQYTVLPKIYYQLKPKNPKPVNLLRAVLDRFYAGTMPRARRQKRSLLP